MLGNQSNYTPPTHTPFGHTYPTIFNESVSELLSVKLHVSTFGKVKFEVSTHEHFVDSIASTFWIMWYGTGTFERVELDGSIFPRVYLEVRNEAIKPIQVWGGAAVCISCWNSPRLFHNLYNITNITMLQIYQTSRRSILCCWCEINPIWPSLFWCIRDLEGGGP